MFKKYIILYEMWIEMRIVERAQNYEGSLKLELKNNKAAPACQKSLSEGEKAFVRSRQVLGKP